MPVHQHGYNVNIRKKPRREFSIGVTLSPTVWYGLFSLQSISSPAKLKFSGYWTAVLRDGKKKSHTNFLHVVRFGVAGRSWFWLVVVGCVLVAVGRGGYGGGGGGCG